MRRMRATIAAIMIDRGRHIRLIDSRLLSGFRKRPLNAPVSFDHSILMMGRIWKSMLNSIFTDDPSVGMVSYFHPFRPQCSHRPSR